MLIFQILLLQLDPGALYTIQCMQCTNKAVQDKEGRRQGSIFTTLQISNNFNFYGNFKKSRMKTYENENFFYKMLPSSSFPFMKQSQQLNPNFVFPPLSPVYDMQ